MNDGHSRVSNRDPSYYRGPQDPNNPWYHVGFRVVRNYSTSTGLYEIQKSFPTGYQLFQNYPNPFNPSTMIRYQLSVVSRVTLKVYNVLGQEIATLVDGVKSPGIYAASLDGSKLGSGIYFCAISDGMHRSTIKMILIK